MGVLGNNSQTELATTIGDNRVTNTTSGKSVCVSGYSEGNEDYDGNTKPTPPDGDKKVTKPIDKQIAEESSKPATGVALNQYGLPINRDLNQFQQADINSARAEAETKNLSPEESTKLIRKRVQKGISDRAKEANSPRSDVKPGATIESEATMIQTVSDLKRDRVYCEKRVLLKPDNLVESTNKAMQTDMDNLVQNIDKAMNALQSYTDAVSITQEQQNLSKLISDSSKRQSKYMKPVMDKMMEYSQKSINKEMTKAVSALPAYKRMEFLDVKDGIGQNLLSSYLGMTNGNAGLIEGIIRKTLKLDEMIDQFANAAVNDTSSDGETKKPKGMPRVPICKSEDVISTVLAVNKSLIDQTNNNLIGGIDGFLMDAIGDVADVSGGVTSIFSKLGNIKGSLTSALNFENIKMNVFPFEKTPNPAVSDYYTLCDGGGAQSQSALPSATGMEKAASKHINKIAQLAEGQSYVETIPQVAFGEPDKSTSDVDLTEGGVETIDIEITDDEREELRNVLEID
jgi:hypothetical protein